MTRQDAIRNVYNTANEHGIVVKVWTADDVADKIQQREEFMSMSRKEYRTAVADAMSGGYFRSLGDCVDSEWMLLSEAVTEALEGV